jgi:hypothetical protein
MVTIIGLLVLLVLVMPKHVRDEDLVRRHDETHIRGGIAFVIMVLIIFLMPHG